jgi:hypothetical protein
MMGTGHHMRRGIGVKFVNLIPDILREGFTRKEITNC